MDVRYKNMPPMGVPQYGGGGAQYGRGWIPGGRVQCRLEELKFPPVNQPQCNAFSIVEVKHVTGEGFFTTSNATIIQHAFYR